jgi:hypothetical protein
MSRITEVTEPVSEAERSLVVYTSPSSLQYIYDSLLKLAPILKQDLGISPELKGAEIDIIRQFTPILGKELVVYAAQPQENKRESSAVFVQALLEKMLGPGVWSKLSPDKKQQIITETKSTLDDQSRQVVPSTASTARKRLRAVFVEEPGEEEVSIPSEGSGDVTLTFPELDCFECRLPSGTPQRGILHVRNSRNQDCYDIRSDNAYRVFRNRYADQLKKQQIAQVEFLRQRMAAEELQARRTRALRGAAAASAAAASTAVGGLINDIDKNFYIETPDFVEIPFRLSEWADEKECSEFTDPYTGQRLTTDDSIVVRVRDPSTGQWTKKCYDVLDFESRIRSGELKESYSPPETIAIGQRAAHARSKRRELERGIVGSLQDQLRSLEDRAFIPSLTMDEKRNIRDRVDNLEKEVKTLISRGISPASVEALNRSIAAIQTRVQTPAAVLGARSAIGAGGVGRRESFRP